MLIAPVTTFQSGVNNMSEIARSTPYPVKKGEKITGYGVLRAISLMLFTPLWKVVTGAISIRF